MESLFGWGILLWMLLLVFLFFVGGFFMFRKFLKRLPKEDGKSILDWQDHYIQETLHLWTEEGKQLLNELVSPVPELFRDTAKQTIAGRIGQLALEENASEIDLDIILRGYISGTPKRDHKFLMKHLDNKGIDYSNYMELLK